MKSDLLWNADLGNGYYKNPILMADFSDPDVIRVEDTYYMTASSFNYLPGLPILTSKDLIHWELVNHALENIPYEAYNTPQHSKGVWAPSIRYHNNTFYIYFAMPDEGIFMVSTRNPLDKWSDLVCLFEGKGYIDPCPFWDDNDEAYLVHAYAKSRIGFNSKLGIFKMSSDGSRLLSENSFIYDGTKTQPTIEGPKVYKRDGYYYIFAPAGGVTNGWQTVLRSKNIYGPYEEKIVMHQGNTDINGPHQGGLVTTELGEDWFIHFQDAATMGRITHLQPVNFIGEWPVIGNNRGGIGEPVEQYKKPDIKLKEELKPHYLSGDDSFREESLNLCWQWMGNYREDFYSLSKEEGLRLYSMCLMNGLKNVLWNYPNVLTQRLLCPDFVATVQLNYSNLEVDEYGGFGIIGKQYAYLAIKRTKTINKIQFVKSNLEDEMTERVEYESFIHMEDKTILMQIQFHHKEGAKFGILNKRNEFLEIGSFQVEEGTWVGVRLALFSIAGKKENHSGYIAYQNFEVKRKEHNL